MGKIITQNTNPMIGKTVKYKEKGVTVTRTIMLEKFVSNQRLYYVSDLMTGGVFPVDANTYDRLFKTTTSRVHRKFKVKTMTQRRRA